MPEEELLTVASGPLPYGFCITEQGYQIISSVMAGNKKMRFAGVAFGDGHYLSVSEAMEATDLAAKASGTVVDGSTTVPDFELETVETENGTFVQQNMSFILEYRSNSEVDTITGRKAINITDVFSLNEFGVYAYDPADNLAKMIFYGTLGDYPQPVTPFSQNAIDIRRFPVTIALSPDAEIVLEYKPVAFVTHEEMCTYVAGDKESKYEIDQREVILREDTLPAISVHNLNPESHPYLIDKIRNHENRITDIEKRLNGTGSTAFGFQMSEIDYDNIPFSYSGGAADYYNAIYSF